MSVLDLCDREIAAVGLEATVADAIHKMLDHHVGAVAVVDSEYRVAGIFTERDVLRKMALNHVDPKATSVREGTWRSSWATGTRYGEFTA